MQILATSLTLSTPHSKSSPLTQQQHLLSSSHAISLLPKLWTLSLTLSRPPPVTLIIRMGGGPRTYPGGVSKWQWKRMQTKKAQQLLKARLSRERQIYEMRKRAELKAAVSNLERPWEVVQKGALKTSSPLFSVSADEQLKVLADRFQKPGGFDLWSDNDGPQIFHTPEGLPSARFFPKGVVHSIKPYGRVDDGFNRHRFDQGSIVQNKDASRNVNPRTRGIDGKRGKNVNFNVNGGDEKGRNLMKSGGEWKTSSNGTRNKSKRGHNSGHVHGEGVYDMSLQGDGSYGFNGRNHGSARQY